MPPRQSRGGFFSSAAIRLRAEKGLKTIGATPACAGIAQNG